MQTHKQSDGNIKVLVEGVERSEIVAVSEEKGLLKATVRTLQLSR